MRVKSLIIIADTYGLHDEDMEDMNRFMDLFVKDTRHPAMCGCCEFYKTEKCPWQDSRIFYAPCLEFKSKEGIVYLKSETEQS